MRRLVLLRHGESVWNAEGRIQGQRGSGLTEVGRAQAQATAAALAAAHPHARVVTSDLPRCLETTAPLTAALGVEAELEPLLRERAFGDWEGLLRDEMASRDPERWERWRAGDDVIAEVGGESSTALVDRIEPVFRALLATTPDGATTVAVTHGGPVWHGTHRLLGVPPGTFGGVSNASVTELLGWADGVGPGGRAAAVVLDRWNEVAHLPVALRTGWRPRSAAPAPPVGR